MDSLFILIPIAVLFTVVSLGAFIWAVDSKQYDDLDAEGSRILFDTEEPKSCSSLSHSTSTGAEDGAKSP